MNILIRPLITEKMTTAGEKLGAYGFVVDRGANKIQIKQAVEAMYSVTVNTVNTMNYYGKARSRNTKAGAIEGRKNMFKKAVVVLKDGDSIDFYSGI